MLSVECFEMAFLCLGMLSIKCVIYVALTCENHIFLMVLRVLKVSPNRPYEMTVFSS